jgi:hypothetical protein
VKGEAAKSPLTNISTGDYRYPEKGRRLTTDGDEVLSYDWWKIAFRDNDGVWVTTDRYQTGEWKSGKPKYSPTTDGHIQAVVDALHYAGYQRAGVNRQEDSGFSDYARHYELYQKDSDYVQ